MNAAMGRTLPALAAGIVASVLAWAVGYALALQYGVAVSGCLRTEEGFGRRTTTVVNRRCMAALPDAPPEPLTLAVVVGLVVALAWWAHARTRRGQ